MTLTIVVGVLALQGGFHEHLKLSRAAAALETGSTLLWHFIEVRTPAELSRCDALIIPGGESTTMSLVAVRSGLLEPLRDFVTVHRKPTWGTCAGLILLAESANRTKKGGQELIGGLSVRVNRNHFGRQTESFEADLDLPFLAQVDGDLVDEMKKPFRAIFIRAPVVEEVLTVTQREHLDDASNEDTVVAPNRAPADVAAEKQIAQPVEIMATLVARRVNTAETSKQNSEGHESREIIAVRQGNVFGTSFHPELTKDARIHVWWLQQVKMYFEAVGKFNTHPGGL